MRNALIFRAVLIWVVSLLIVGLKGKQSRRERDGMEAGRAEQDQAMLELSSPCDAIEQPKDV